jgi:hypothetical protein
MIAAHVIRPTSIATDPSNNVIVGGDFDASVDFGGVTRIPIGFDAFVAKYTAQGTLVWVKDLPNVGRVYSVAADSQGNVVIAGAFGGTMDFGGQTRTANDPTGWGQQDTFVAKYSSSGNLIWVKQFGGILADTGKAVAVDASGNVLLAAAFQYTSDFGGISLTSSANSMDVAVVKLSGATGATLWAKGYGGSADDYPNGLVVDRSGDVVVTGQATGPIDLGGGLTGNGGIFAAKYSGTDGTYRWAKVVSGGIGNGVATDPATGNVFVTGSSAGALDFGGGPVIGGVFIAAYGPTGNYLWARGYGASGDSGMAIAVDGNGNLALTGQFTSALNFGNGSMYGSGWFIADFTVSGNLPPVVRWSKHANSTSYGSGLAYDSLGHLLMTGCFQILPIDFGGLTVTPRGYTDGFVVQYTP